MTHEEILSLLNVGAATSIPATITGLLYYFTKKRDDTFNKYNDSLYEDGAKCIFPYSTNEYETKYRIYGFLRETFKGSLQGEIHKEISQIFCQIFHKLESQPDSWEPIWISLKVRTEIFAKKVLVANEYPYDLRIQNAYKDSEKEFLQNIKELLNGFYAKASKYDIELITSNDIFAEDIALPCKEQIRLIGKSIDDTLALIKNDTENHAIFSLKETNNRYLKDTLAVYHSLKQVDPVGAETMLGQSLNIIQKGVDKYRDEALSHLPNDARANENFLRTRFEI